MQRQHKHMSFNIQHKVVGLVLGLLFPVSMAWGQTMEEADKEYKALLEMQNQMVSDTTVTQERFLEAALACSQTFVSLCPVVWKTTPPRKTYYCLSVHW